MTPDGSALSVQQVTHRYREASSAHAALQDLSFSVRPGERFGLLGPNGGGKTTLFRLIATLLAPSTGTVTVFDADTQQDPARVRSLLGIVFQTPALDDHLTVRESLRAHAALTGVPRTETAQRIESLLGEFGLTDRANQKIKTLSGGLARRTDLARVLLHRPPLLLLDEPTTGLDIVARRELWDALDTLHRSHTTTQVVATHLMDEAERCDRIAILDRGHLVALDTPEALKDALGGEVLWLDTPDPDGLAVTLQDGLGVATRRIGKTVLVETDRPAERLADVYQLASSAITQAAIRRPSLEDVFVAHTGREFTEEAP